jgi:hypothetical protein
VATTKFSNPKTRCFSISSVGPFITELPSFTHVRWLKAYFMRSSRSRQFVARIVPDDFTYAFTAFSEKSTGNHSFVATFFHLRNKGNYLSSLAFYFIEPNKGRAKMFCQTSRWSWAASGHCGTSGSAAARRIHMDLWLSPLGWSTLRLGSRTLCLPTASARCLGTASLG